MRRQLVEEKLALYHHVLAHLQNAEQPLAFIETQYLKLAQQEALRENKNLQAIVTADLERQTEELSTHFQTIMTDISLEVLRRLIERRNPAWKNGEPPLSDFDTAALFTKLTAYSRNHTYEMPFARLSVCVDPRWDEQLTLMDPAEKAWLLQRLIGALASEFITDTAAFYLARVTRTAGDYKVWLINAAAAEGILTVRFKRADLEQVSLTDLVKHPDTSALPLRDERQSNWIQASVNHIAVLAETEVIETAKLEMGMNVDKDPAIAKAKAEAVARVELNQAELRRLEAEVKACWDAATPAVSQRVQAAPGYQSLVQDIETLKSHIEQQLLQQQQAVTQQQSKLEEETRRLAALYQDDVHDKIGKISANNLANVLLQAIDDYLTILPETSRDPVLQELLQALALPSQESRLSLRAYVNDNLDTEALLEKINFILQKSKHLILREGLEELLVDLQVVSPAFDFSKTKRVLLYNPEQFANQQRHLYVRTLDDDKVGLLQKIEHIGFHGDWLEAYRAKVQQLTKCFENEQANYERLMPISHEAMQYRQGTTTRLETMQQSVDQILAEYQAAVPLFPGMVVAPGVEHTLKNLQQEVHELVGYINTCLKKLSNLASVLSNPRTGTGVADKMEDQIRKNKALILSHYDEIDRLTGQMTALVSPCITLKVERDNWLEKTYSELRSLALHPEFLQQCVTSGLRAGGEKVEVNKKDYRVHSHVAAVAKAIQKLDQDGSLSLAEKIAAVMQAYQSAVNAVPTGLFAKREKPPVPGEAAGDFCATIAKLQQFAKSSGSEQTLLLQVVCEDLKQVAKKNIASRATAKSSPRLYAAKPDRVLPVSEKTSKNKPSGGRSKKV
jgi:hypothetical protein